MAIPTQPLRIDHHSDGGSASVDPDAVITMLAAAQQEVFARRQLLTLGVGRGAIELRLRRGRIHLVHHGVYTTVHGPLPARSRWMAAVLAAGADAVLSHRAAAALYAIRDFYGGRIEVTVPRVVQRPEIRAYVSIVPVHERALIHGIPVTSLDRTLIDLAAVLPRRQVERAIEQAVRRDFTNAARLDELLTRHPRRAGTAAVRAILRRGRLGRTFTRSGLEEAFLAYVGREGLPIPEMNAAVEILDGWVLEVDAVWHGARVAVELDSREWHSDDAAFGSDRFKSRRLSVAGWHPIRVAPEHLETALLGIDLRRLLANSTNRPSR